MIDVCEREKIARERKIKKTSESIRKKHHTLNTDRIEEDMAFNKYFKPIIKPLRQIVDSPVRAIKSPVRQSRDDNLRGDLGPLGQKYVGGIRYAGTPGLYELIFKRIPDDLFYTEDNMNKYKSILLATNAHKHKH
ncbi:hypothetical protein ALC53_01771 [Atta colombica]|uniref:DUF8207 domain-containing protein n=1 Tax=Atta colombica TaxID=520822 RepID=A0A151I5Z0_9HYME|nr:hypothetical protein ALC53_01771 [Atta colombica]